jgi:ABC-type phosphate transport system substrate-binding protein
MKKVMILFAASLIFAACGGSSEQAAQDSTKVDSSVVVAGTDTVAPSVDSVKSEVIEQPKEVK